ncbi:MAG TPA: DnaA/Hda family protein [Gemmatimonadales bacterium]|nr:DnaA/Hda family protein [Gemmatimonadales bacterium]
MLNPHASFASFVVGSSNRLAATAAKAVAEAPGAMYNPLFIYARPGLGKTHLLMAIGNEALAFSASRTVEYVTVDDFVEAYQAALAAGQADAYRRRFTEADLVLLDDAQLLADRRELQSELLRLIDVLTAADRQIVLAGDRPPEEIQQLDERLIRRFAGGLVIDIGAPDYETRLAILSRRAAERQATFIPAVLDTVAELPITTVRELLGALNRLIAQQAVQSDPLTIDQARKVLETLGHRRVDAAGSGTAEPRSTPRDEFTDFLSDLTSSVAQRVDRWRQRLTESALRWAGEGFRTGRLDALLAGDLTEDPADALFAFEQDIVRLRELQAELETFAPELVSEAVLHDPDRVADAERFVVDAREAGPPLPGPLPRFTLEVFTAGPSTRPAVEAIRTAATAPGQRYNPLVIVGRPGSGKTHLLNAFGHALRQGGLPRVAVLDGRTFVQDLVEALGNGTITRWRQRLRRVDAFLLDDVGALAGKERSQEELYLLYNLLLESGRQMAFTSATPPAAMSGFEERLATRLSGGLVVELGLPDREAKLREVERLLGAAAVDPELVDYLSSRPASSLREVQQLVTRLVHAADERAVTLSLAVARRILEGEREEPMRPARRGSGLLAPGSGALRSREKMIETWPDVAERVIEDRI